MSSRSPYDLSTAPRIRREEYEAEFQLDENGKPFPYTPAVLKRKEPRRERNESDL